MVMSDIARFRDIEEIKKLKSRYLRFADIKQWQELAECFCGDVTCDYRGSTTDPSSGKNLLPGSDAVLVGRDQCMATIIEAMSNIQSVHRVFMPEIEITSDNEAAGIWAMADRLYIPTDTGQRILQGYGHYHDAFKRIDAHWKIQTLRLTRLKVETFF
jgi:hypothetical protein